MDKKERFASAVAYLKAQGRIKNQKQLAEILEASESTISKALKGHPRYLNDVFLNRFNKCFGNIFNINWLLTGSGDMLGDALPVSLTNHVGVRLVSQYAYAGYLSGYADSEYMETLPVIDFTPDRNMTGNYLAFEVKGDSMDDGSKDAYIQGEILICREVEPYNWQRSPLHFRKRDFVIVHSDGILIKRITAHDVERHIITIHSLNPEYPDRDIDLADVRQIFSVVESRKQRIR